MNYGVDWVRAAEQSAHAFAASYGTKYHFNWANLAAAFEVHRTQLIRATIEIE